jgi:hypothetical protein
MVNEVFTLVNRLQPVERENFVESDLSKELPLGIRELRSLQHLLRIFLNAKTRAGTPARVHHAEIGCGGSGLLFAE